MNGVTFSDKTTSYINSIIAVKSARDVPPIGPGMTFPFEAWRPDGLTLLGILARDKIMGLQSQLRDVQSQLANTELQLANTESQLTYAMSIVNHPIVRAQLKLWRLLKAVVK